MNRPTVGSLHVTIPEPACAIVLSHHDLHALRPILLGKITVAPVGASRGAERPRRVVVCTIEEAIELERYFRHRAAFYELRADSEKAIVCTEASGNARDALEHVGITIR